MSVTFWCPEAPREAIETPCWGECDETCPMCHGTNVTTEQVSPHEMNLANANAYNILLALGVQSDESMCGGWETPEDIRTIRAAILKARNVTGRREGAHRDAESYGGPGTGTCRVVSQGYTDEQVLDRLTRLDKLLAYALENSHRVVWG
jgi:hypothetical protein